MSKNELNELRCQANEIIRCLFKAKEVGQLQLLHMACSLSIKILDPVLYQRMLKDAQSGLKQP